MDQGVLPVILCGGSGSRLWPLSTAERPKPFHPLAGDETLLQATVRRLAPSPAAPFQALGRTCAVSPRPNETALLATLQAALGKRDPRV